MSEFIIMIDSTIELTAFISAMVGGIVIAYSSYSFQQMRLQRKRYKLQDRIEYEHQLRKARRP